MKHNARDYWSFVEKIHDATDYVQELLTENRRLRRRMVDLEQEKAELARELAQLSQLLDRGRDVPSLPSRSATPPQPSLRLAQ